MRIWHKNHLFYCLIVIFLAAKSSAATFYVDVNGSNPISPYADWSTAATNIQDAIDASSDGDQILVTNGIYQTGGRVVYGALTNRVVVDKAVIVQSVNGPAVTIIQGYQIPSVINGDNAIRSIYLTNNSSLIGFTITNGATRYLYSGDAVKERSGGGIWCEDTSVIISNCVVAGNSCFWFGAGVYSGTLINCQITGNNNRNTSEGGGGGAAYSTLINCLISSNLMQLESLGGGIYSCLASNCNVVGNANMGAINSVLNFCNVSNNTSTANGGGAYFSVLNYCQVAGNTATNYGGGAYDCVLNNCVISNNAAAWGGGVYYDFYETNSLLQNNTIVGNTASYYGGGLYAAANVFNTNIDSWTFISNSAARDGGGVYLNGTPAKAFFNNCIFSGNFALGSGGGFYTGANILINFTNCVFSGNVAVGNGGGAYYGALNNSLIIGNKGGSGGGVYGTVNYCVIDNNIANINGGGVCIPTSVGTTFFFNNNYFTNNFAGNGGGAYGGNFSNCVFFANSAITNGGGFSMLTSQGSTLQSCVLVSNVAAYGGGEYGAILQNSIVSSNQAAFGGGAYGNNYASSFNNCSFIGNLATNSGGGIYAVNFNNITNCIFGKNQATINGGGAYGGTFSKCTFFGNSAGNGGGASAASLTGCTISNNWATTNGGGTYDTTMKYCQLTGNSAANGGGTYGEYNRLVVTCLFASNTAAYGGGAYGCFLNNSTLVNNTATNIGGGAYLGGGPISCIMYYNTAPSGANYTSSINPYSYCCTTPLPSSSNNTITNDPIFVNLTAGNYRLQTNSPCINVGYGVNSGSTDLDGRPRFVGGNIDIGAYEFQGPGIGEFIGWLQQYGLPTDGSADYVDSDGDGMSNWQEWKTGTIPTNALSVLKLLSPVVISNSQGLLVTWQSVTNITYYIQSSTNFTSQPMFQTIQTNITGQVGTTSYTDTNAVGAGPFFYRVGVQ
jgi:predicted outer membrane repeat protein